MTSLARRTAALALAVLVPLGAGGTEKKPFDQLVPEGAALFLSLRDASAARRWFEASPFADACKGQEVQAFWKELSAFLAAEVQKDEKGAGREVIDLLGLLRGEAALVIGDASKLDAKELKEDMPLAVLLDAGADRDKAREALGRLVSKLRDREDQRVSETEFRGTRIHVVEDKTASKGEPRMRYLAQADDVLVFGLSKAFVQDLLANRTESAVKPLSENPEYKALRERHGKDAVLSVYASPMSLIQLGLKASAEEGGAEASQAAMLAPGILGLLGISNMKALWASASLGKDDITTTAFCSVSGPPKGLVKVLWTKPQPLRFPALIPDDVASCSVLQLNLEALWELIEGAARLGMTMAGGGLPEGAQDPIAMIEQRLGIKVREDLIAPLGGQLVGFTRLRKPYDEGSSKGALLVEIKDRDRFQATLDKLLAMTPFKKNDYLGRPLYSLALDLEGQDEEEGGGKVKGKAEPKDAADEPIALAVTESHFVVGLPRGHAEEVIRRVGKEVKSVNDSPGFKAVAARFPPSAIALSYQSSELLEYAFAMIRQGATQASVLGLAGLAGDEGDRDQGGSDHGEGEDGAGGKPSGKGREEARKALLPILEKLPPASLFTRHIAGFVSHGFVEERGLGFTSVVVLKRKE
ncbi:MAG: hypothetical protein HY721_17225 [Planctomycetes bacterium]|nr:hypothetical protein [Planctomycetota bacterium]